MCFLASLWSRDLWSWPFMETYSKSYSQSKLSLQILCLCQCRGVHGNFILMTQVLFHIWLTCQNAWFFFKLDYVRRYYFSGTIIRNYYCDSILKANLKVIVSQTLAAHLETSLCNNSHDIVLPKYSNLLLTLIDNTNVTKSSFEQSFIIYYSRPE